MAHIDVTGGSDVTKCVKEVTVSKCNRIHMCAKTHHGVWRDTIVVWCDTYQCGGWWHGDHGGAGAGKT